jgi:UDP-N-acetylglucosamine diphosphorylase/glucosamine-1-phosphate N-acetyltransferase
MQINLFDPKQIRENLLPFTFTRPVACIRIGILTISEKWEKYGFQVGFETQDYLSEKYKALSSSVRVNGAICPDKHLVEAIKTLDENSQLVAGEVVLAINGAGEHTKSFHNKCRLIQQPWEIFQFNREQIEADFELITKGRTSQPITDEHTIVYGKKNLFIEEGASIRAAIINAEHGPVYIGKDAHVHEGAIIHGAFALCEGSHVNMGAKIKGDSTVGPFSKVGGEVSNSVIFGYSNKGHDGFLGSSVIGEWCNLGADTNTSNLKNNYAHVKLWNYSTECFEPTGLQFCGLMMGDHAKCGINTMFNTGTVVGVGANVFGAGFPKNFIPSYAWGGASDLGTFQTKKFYEVAEAVMKRRGLEFSSVEKEITDKVFELTAQYRTWEKP